MAIYTAEYTAVESYRKHIGDLQRTGPCKARVGRRKRSVAGFDILLACYTQAHAVHATPKKEIGRAV